MTLAVCPECGGTFAGTDRFCQRDGARLLEADEADPLLGQSVGSYRIAALLGAGGMGRVYLGVHPTIGSRVAIKVLARDSAGRRDLVDRFFAEAMVVNKIRHEGIVNVLDLALLPDGRPYIVMELLSGEPLSAMLARLGQLEPAHAVAIVCPLLDALAAAHDQGVVHRDLKPDNVFVTRQGRVVVLDFGIAKLLPENQTPGGGGGSGGSPPGVISPSTRTGAVLGTPGYMSPEQILGKPIGPPADLYAVGVILFQALVGRLPFHADSPFEMMHKHIGEVPASTRAARPDVSPALDAAVLRALAKDPRERFPGARAMIQALNAALAMGHAVPPPVAQRPPPRQSRGGLVAGLAIGGALAAAIAALVLVQVRSDEPTGEADVVAATAASAAGTADAPAAAAPTAEPHGDAPPAPTPPARERSDEERRVAGGAPPEVPVDEPGRAGQADRPRRDPADRVASAPPPAKPPAAPPLKKPPGQTGSSSSPLAGATSPRPGVTQVGGVTIVNTAEQARAMTGLEPISAPLAVRGGAFDPLRTLTQAEAMARKLMPDAMLVGLDIDQARPDGMALVRADSGASYRFRSPARSKRPPGAAQNEEIDIPCMVHVDAEDGRLVAGPVTDEECDDRRLARPRCTIVHVWERARAEGAPRTGNWVGRVSLLGDGWFIDIAKAGPPPTNDFTLTVPDDCR